METLLAEIERAVAEGVFPGASIWVSLGGDRVCSASAGWTSLGPDRTPVDETTLFDIASLTKPLATTLLVARMIERNRLRLEETVGDILPEAAETDKAPITIEQLLSHCAGLQDWRPFHQGIEREGIPFGSLEARAWVLSEILADPLVTPPGEKALYSDLGFILLGAIVEEATDDTLDRLFARDIARPLGLGPASIGYRPIGVDGEEAAEAELCAATEDCPWRGKVLRGEVHDENAWALGGVAGHAGLFATAAAVGQTGQAMLGCLRKNGLVRSRTAKELLRRREHPAGTTWALGWDTPTPGKSTSGRFLSPSSVGGLGFTGCSLWMDPERSLVVVLLTNRVHPTRANDAICAFRPRFHDLVIQCLRL